MHACDYTYLMLPVGWGIHLRMGIFSTKFGVEKLDSTDCYNE